MLIIHGTYHFFARKTGFRNDYCLSCNAKTRSFRVRTFDVLHLFWIPLLPLDFWSRWFCGTCGKRPHSNVRTRRSFKVAGLVLLVALAVIFWSLPVDPGKAVGFWFCRLASPLGIVATFIHLRNAKRGPNLKEFLAAVEPANDFVCPICGTPLVASGIWTCPRCGIQRC